MYSRAASFHFFVALLYSRAAIFYSSVTVFYSFVAMLNSRAAFFYSFVAILYSFVALFYSFVAILYSRAANAFSSAAKIRSQWPENGLNPAAALIGAGAQNIFPARRAQVAPSLPDISPVPPMATCGPIWSAVIGAYHAAACAGGAGIGANMAKGFLPTTDAGLLAWSLNFKTLIQSGAVSYGLTVILATAYGVLHDAFASALAAADPAIRTRGSVAAKNLARANLKSNARLLARLVQGTASVTDAQKLSLGLNVRSAPTPIPPPADAPGLDVLSVSGWTVKIRLHDTASGAKRGKPPGVVGASVFTFVGATPPADIGAWQFEGNTGRTKLDVPFPNTLAAGAKVWITAFWFNGRKQSGPNCAPVTTNLPGGSVTMAA